MKKTKLIKILGVVLGLTATAANVMVPEAMAATINSNQSAGTLLNQSRDYFEQEALRRRLEEEKNKVREGIVNKESGKEIEASGKEQTFFLKDVQAEQSKVIPAKAWTDMVEPYKNKDVKIKDLYELVGKINKYYQKHGYVTCKAFLPKQKIENGVVHLRLIEGTTGQIKVEGNKSTRKGNIVNRIALKEGRIDNVNDLNKSLLWYNGTNDVQLRIALKAGEKIGTTDYYITAYEPKQHNFSVFVDNSGSENTGFWREGLSYVNRSLTGNRDQLYVTGMRSEGTDSAAIGYTTPITNKGLKLGLQYSGNSVKMVKGILSEADTHGSAISYGLSLTQPLVVDKTKKVEASLEWNKQNSKMEIGDQHWLDDTLDRYTASLAFTHYGNSSVFYHKHSVLAGKWDDIEGNSVNYSKYNMNFISQKVFTNKQMLSFKGGAQWGFSHYLPSAEQFYIGGVYSVRGYLENLMGADSGYNLSVEYSVPDRKNSEWMYFIDHGNTLGDNRFDDHMLTSMGLGYKINFQQKLYASLALGIPLQRDCNGSETSKARLHFMMNGTF